MAIDRGNKRMAKKCGSSCEKHTRHRQQCSQNHPEDNNWSAIPEQSGAVPGHTSHHVGPIEVLCK